jgi:putative intracellular protease/amidase
MRLSIILFDGFTTLDVVGGYEVLARIPGMDVEFVAASKGVVAADTRKLGLAAYRTFDEVMGTDILYVPGGPGARPLERDRGFHDYLRMLDATSQWTVGVCNGCTLLAAAGILTSRATTNWFDRNKLREYGVEFVAERYHREGKYITGAGVSASIDTALFLANILAGSTVAMAIQLGIEYFPMPPFAERTPAESPAPIQHLVQHFEGIEAQRWKDRAAPFEALHVSVTI